MNPETIGWCALAVLAVAIVAAMVWAMRYREDDE